MFQHSTRRDFAEIERRMQRVEQRLERLGQVASRKASSGFAEAAGATDRAGEAIVSALTDLVDRFRGGARTEATRFGNEAVRLSHEAGKLGGHALRRLTTEIEHRPLVTLAIAAGIGLLIGLGGRRH